MLDKKFDIYDKDDLEEVDLCESIKLAIEHQHADIVEYILIKDDALFQSKLMKHLYKRRHFKSKPDKKNEENKVVENTDNCCTHALNKLKFKIFKYDDTGEEINLNILDLAISSNNEETAKIIINNAELNELKVLLANVKLNENDDYVLTFWDLIKKMPNAAEMCLDKFLDLQENKTKFELDFSILDKRYFLECDEVSSFDVLENPMQKEKRSKLLMTHTNTLDIMVDTKAEKLLRHPLVQAFLYKKWNCKAILFYIGGMSLYLAFTILLSLYLILYHDDNIQNTGLSITVFILSIILIIKS